MNTLSILTLITATAVSPLSAAVLVKYDFDTDHLGNAITGSLTGGNDGLKVNTVYPSISFGQGTSEQRVRTSGTTPSTTRLPTTGRGGMET